MVGFRAILLAMLCVAAVPVTVEAQTGSISGVVTDDSGAPLMGVRVRATDGSMGGFGFGNVDFTDMDGAYLIDDLAPGTYEVRANRFGYEAATDTADVVADTDTVVGFTLLEPTFGNVSGVITDATSGDPIDGAFVRLRNVGGGGGFGGFFGGFFGSFAVTGADGAYSFTDVRTGDREVRASADSYITQTIAVTVMDGVDSTVDVALDAETFGSISGVITDAGTTDPIEGAFVVLRGNGGFFGFGGWNFTTTDATGAYSFSDVSTGDREIRVFAAGYFSATEMVTVTDGVDTVANIALGGLTFGSLSGTVTDAVTGDPIEGAWVRVASGGWTQTDRLGNYEYTDILSGTRTVRVFANGYVNAMADVDVLDGQSATADFSLDPR